MTVYWTNEALDEVTAIRDYLLEHSPQRAEAIVDELFDKAWQLGSLPHLGRPYNRSELPQVRELLVGNYRIIYYVAQQQVEIMMVRHQSQRR